MAKLQIKSEKPLFWEDFFSGRGANPLTLTLTVQKSDAIHSTELSHIRSPAKLEHSKNGE